MADATKLAGSVAVSTLIVGASSGVFAQFGPSMFTISSSFFHENGSKEGNVKRIRNAEVLGSAVTVAMGWGGSVLTGTILPLLVSVAYSAVSVAAWEYAIKHPASGD